MKKEIIKIKDTYFYKGVEIGTLKHSLGKYGESTGVFRFLDTTVVSEDTIIEALPYFLRSEVISTPSFRKILKDDFSWLPVGGSMYE